jgi:AAA family ATP:ADP antiporter
LPALIQALDSERTRSAARQALVAQAQAGFTAVRAALTDTSLPRRLRWELPRTLALFEPERALSSLLTQLTAEPDGMVRYRIIRALEILAAKHPRLHPDSRTLQRVISETVTRAYRHLDERLGLERGVQQSAERRTEGHALLVSVLQSKERNAVGRLLHLLGLAHPQADFASIRQSLRSPSLKLRAASVELLGTLLSQPLREAVLGLVEDMPDAQRLAAAGSYYHPARLDYAALLSGMLARESPAIQDFTAYHIAELRLHRLRPQLEKLVEADPQRADLARALSMLVPESSGEPELAHAD